MRAFNLTVLGTSSSLPAFGRKLSAQVIDTGGHFFLIDCGEATQMQLRRFNIKFQRIEHILISHLHGDHIFGLAGLISSMHMLGRTSDLHLYGPPDLQKIIDIQLKYADTRLKFAAHFHPLNCQAQEMIFEDESLTVETIALAHSVPCCGFLFREKPGLRRVKQNAIEKYEIPVNVRKGIKRGEPYKTPDGKVISNAELTSPPPPPRSFAYCSDTAYSETIVPMIKEVNLLYHEATFMHDLAQRARETGHSTAAGAATIAKKAGVGKLIIGHFSARYRDLNPLLEEARSIFANTVLAEEGKQYEIPYLIQIF